MAQKFPVQFFSCLDFFAPVLQCEVQLALYGFAAERQRDFFLLAFSWLILIGLLRLAFCP